MTRFFVTLAFVGGCAFPALSDTGQLTETLRMIPDVGIPADGTLEIAYGNGDAVRAIARNGNPAWPADDWAHDFAAARAAPPAQASALAAGGGEAMSLLTRDWVHSLEVAAGPVRMGVHSLFPDSEMRLRGAFFGAGMEAATRNGEMVLWSGRTDHEATVGAVDPENPFGGAEGLALRAVVRPDWALWASGWPQIEAMQSGFGVASILDRPAVAQVATALEGNVRRFGRLAAVRARIDPGGIGEGFDGLPVVGLFEADIVNRREETAFLGLLFEPGTDLESVALRLRERWGGSMLARWSPEPQLVSLPGFTPGLMLVLSGDWGEDEARRNDALAALDRALENGTIAALIAP